MPFYLLLAIRGCPAPQDGAVELHGPDTRLRVGDAAAASMAALEDMLAADAPTWDVCFSKASWHASRTVTGASLQQLCQVSCLSRGVRKQDGTSPGFVIYLALSRSSDPA